MRDKRQLRAAASKFQTREDGGAMVIEGYFAVYNSNYDITSDMSESIAPGAFAGSLSGDIRALVNHDSTLVLGRTKANTLQLRDEAHGLWGRIEINPNDGDAVNLYERVKRGDVDQCSIGFMINREETEFNSDGSMHWTIKEAELFEVSCCTFPAYEETNISARARQRDEVKKRDLEAWREKQKGALKKWEH